MAIEREYDPDREPTHPGTIIRDYMEAEGLNQRQLASALDLSRPYLNRIINGKAGLSEEVAIKLGRVFETSAEFWADLNTKRKLWEKRQGDEKILDEIAAGAKIVQKGGTVFLDASFELSHQSSLALMEAGRQVRDTHESFQQSLTNLLVTEPKGEIEALESSSVAILEATLFGEDDQRASNQDEYDRLRNFELSTA